MFNLRVHHIMTLLIRNKQASSLLIHNFFLRNQHRRPLLDFFFVRLKKICIGMGSKPKQEKKKVCLWNLHSKLTDKCTKAQHGNSEKKYHECNSDQNPYLLGILAISSISTICIWRVLSISICIIPIAIVSACPLIWICLLTPHSWWVLHMVSWNYK